VILPSFVDLWIGADLPKNIQINQKNKNNNPFALPSQATRWQNCRITQYLMG
jgi:hypothetical protein